MKEISLHILDILENSVNAMASHIEVAIHVDCINDMLTVSITDNGRGMDPETIMRVIDPFYTTRTTRKIGMGLPLLKQHAEITGGRLMIESKVGVGTKVVATFGLHHIDRQPMGDLAGAIVNVAASYPQIDIVLDIRAPNGIYHFSSAEVKTILGDLSLANPEMMFIIKEMIDANISELKNY